MTYEGSEANNSDFKQEQNNNILRMVHHLKNNRTQPRVNFPSSNRRKECNTLFCLLNLFIHHFINIFS